MVRHNLLAPTYLTDQHLRAEYLEILMAMGYYRLHPQTNNIPETYRLGKGHIAFFKDKLLYLAKRHELIKVEMRKRGFKPTKTIDLTCYPKELLNDWTPRAKDYDIIKVRIGDRLRLKPNWYRYYGDKTGIKHLLELLIFGVEQGVLASRGKTICL